MRIGMLVAIVLYAVAADAATYRVTPDAAGGGNGLAWTDDGAGNAPMTLAEAVTAAKAADDTVVMLKAGRYPLSAGLSLTRPFTLRGGYDGTGDVSLDENSPVSVLDGQDTVENLLTIKYNYAVVHTTTVSRIEFTHAAKRGVYSDTGSCYNLKLVFADCRFTANGMNWNSNAQDGGRGFYARAPRSDRYNELSLTNCYFGGNVTTNSASAGHSGKGALWTYAWSNLDLVDCTFETNGVAWWQPLKGGPVNRAGGGTALRVECGPVSLTRCVFRANRNGSMSESGYGDACVQIYNNQSWAKCDCGLTNCLFIGNESVPNANVSASMTGGLSVYDSKRNATVDVYRCTFAYNLSCTTSGSAGLTVADGNVRVRNSIFFGNRNRPGDYKGCDLKLASSTATADIDYTLFGALGVSNVCNSAGEAFTLGDHVYAGDPKFVTSFADFESLIVKTNVAASGTVNVWAYRPEPAYWSQVVDLDAHVDADDSPAIDMGDDGPYENEPMPNGGVVNLGAYGNTSEAHVTVVAQPEIVDGKLKVTFPYETSQPHVAFALTGEKTYRATAVLAWTTNGTDWVTYETLYGLGNDAVYDRDWLVAFAQGCTLTVRVTVTAPGAEIRSASDTKSIAYPCPPSYGRGGGPTVCHVRAGATGDGSGSDWFNACTAFPKSNNDILSSQTEVWVADDLPVGTGFGEVTVTGPRTFRGGFSGCECTPAERVTGRVTTVDGNGLSDNGISLSPSTALAFERFHFTRFKKRGAYVNAGSNAKIAFTDCRFTANGLGWDSNAQDGGRAVRASSGRANWGNDIAFDRCYFGGNATTNGAHSGKGAVWTSGWGHADFRDCTFETNGVAWWQPLKAGVVTRAGGGTAACITEGCASFARCVFRANRNGCMSESPSSYGDACVQIVNTQTWSPFACGFTNCLFIGNETVPGGDVTSWNSGALSLYDTTEGGPFDIQSCTFAYNVSCTKSASAGLSVNTGAVRVRNSIFYGNRLRSESYSGCDLRLSGTGATADVDYTLFSGTGTVHVCDASGNALALGPHVQAVDPKFVSALTEADALRAVTNVAASGTVNVWAYLPTPAAHVRRLALNAHLRGRAGYVDEMTGCHRSTPHGNSSAIDAGDPLADCAQEPTLFNIGTGGGRLNLGAYGNTPRATLTPFPGCVLRVR